MKTNNVASQDCANHSGADLAEADVEKALSDAPDECSSMTMADYSRAEEFMPYRVDELVLRAPGAPTWVSSDEALYVLRTAEGLTLVLVDVKSEARREFLIDEQIIKEQVPEGMPLDVVGLMDDGGGGALLRSGLQRWRYDLADGSLMRLAHIDPNAVLSPDKTREVFIHDFNLWVRDVLSGRETQLTFDGVRDFGYATDNSGRRHSGRPCVLWSPNSRRLATFQQDQRGVGEVCLVRTERGHATYEAWKYPMPGDTIVPKIHRVVIDVDDTRVVPLRMVTPDFLRSSGWLGLTADLSGELEAQWSPCSTHLAFISVSRDHKCARLRIADAITGAVREILEEQETTFFESEPSWWHARRSESSPNWRYMPATEEALWYSARNGWNHLYLYDAATGLLKHQVTSGPWNVVKVLRVDECERTVYFSAVGREAGRNPYFEYLYKVSFSGERLKLLTPDDGTHAVSIAPTGSYFIDSYSQPNVPAITEVRDLEGRLVSTLEKADISRLVAKGWKPPEQIVVKARDGVTDIYGLLFTPTNFDDRKKYPIINSIYSGPILGSVVGSGGRPLQWGAFAPAWGLLGDAQSLADLGFVVVMIDGLGTPLRSRKFHQVCYRNYGDATLPDQIAGMMQLAARHAWVDIERVGIYGHSQGGYAAARAMLMYPEFFKVGVSIAGNHDPMSYQDEYVEKFMGLCERHADGTSTYEQHGNMGIACQLKGQLLLIHGTMDDNVAHNHTLLLARALMEANKDFDLLLLPNQSHDIGAGTMGRYMVRRYWDFFVRHLRGIQPPPQYEMRYCRSSSAISQ